MIGCPSEKPKEAIDLVNDISMGGVVFGTETTPRFVNGPLPSFADHSLLLVLNGPAGMDLLNGTEAGGDQRMSLWRVVMAC